MCRSGIGRCVRAEASAKTGHRSLRQVSSLGGRALTRMNDVAREIPRRRSRACRRRIAPEGQSCRAKEAAAGIVGGVSAAEYNGHMTANTFL